MSYADAVRNFFNDLKKFKVTPIVIFDGSYAKYSGELRELNEETDPEFLKHFDRFENRIESIRKYTAELKNTERNTKKSSKPNSTIPFAPINLHEILKDILIELEIKHVQCDYGCDEIIAALAIQYKCPILSEDSDFYIYDLPDGVIRFSHLHDTIYSGNTEIEKHICNIYKINTFLQKHSIRDSSLLPIFAVLVGNDYTRFDDFKSFYKQKLAIPENRKIGFQMLFNKLLNWLKNFGTFQEAKIDVLNCYVTRKEQEEKKNKIDNAIKNYEINDEEGKRMSQILDGIYFDNINIIIGNSKINALCDKPLPKQFVVAFHKSLISSTLLNVLNLRYVFLDAQLEEFSNCSSYTCSRYIRQITNSILLQPQNENIDDYQKFTEISVREYDRPKIIGLQTWKRSVESVKILCKLETGEPIPNLYYIYDNEDCSLDSLKQFFAAVLGIDNQMVFFKGLDNLELLFGSIIYWLLKSNPKPMKEFLSALLICITYYKLKEDTFREYKNKKDTTETKDAFPILNVIEKLNKYAQNPEKIIRIYRRICIVHNYSQFQTCVQSAITLNSLLKRPFDSSKTCEFLNGTMLYNLTEEIKSQLDPASFINNLLNDGSVAIDLFKIYMSKIEEKIPNDYFGSV